MTNNVREIVVQQMKMIECKSVVGARGILFQKNVRRKNVYDNTNMIFLLKCIQIKYERNFLRS